VTAIIVILVAVGVPGFRGLVQGQRLKTASFDLFAAVSYARSEAIARNATVTIAATSGSWTNGWTVTDSGGTVLRRQNALSGITVTGPSAVTYSGTGRLTASVTPFALTSSDLDPEDGRCLRIDLSGRPVTKTGTCS
jgi:type IV fimbrial biogenesis protein FimT